MASLAPPASGPLDDAVAIEAAYEQAIRDGSWKTYGLKAHQPKPQLWRIGRFGPGMQKLDEPTTARDI